MDTTGRLGDNRHRAMNYRHAFHAGNFADVLKHVVLALCLEHLKKKPAPFRVLDTHAGAGRYEIGGGAADRTGEWRDGIGRLVDAQAPPLPSGVAAILAPYLQLVGPPPLTTYPGSPAIIARLLRPGDHLVAVERQPEAARRLAALFKGDRRVRAVAGDGWTAVKAELPPPERRGLILIDPPYEAPGELIRLSEALDAGLARFRTGTFLLWYPIKDPKPIARLHRAVAGSAAREELESVLAAELLVRAPRHPQRLNGAGLVIANPPFTLAGALTQVLPVLAARFALGAGAASRIVPLTSP
jgi:23S rRNA (adenine2030-N6)-methyltransferase